MVELGESRTIIYGKFRVNISGVERGFASQTLHSEAHLRSSLINCNDRLKLFRYSIIMDKRLHKYFDESLRDVPTDPEGLRSYTRELEQSLLVTTNFEQRAKFLGELGVHLRTLGELDQAEKCLRESLGIIEDRNLGLKKEIQQKIRLAHVLQWKRNFKKSHELFDEIISICRAHDEVSGYLDFAFQHAGKNLFDQKKYKEALVFFEEAFKLRKKKQAPQDQIDSTLMAIERTRSLLGNR